MTSDYPNKKSGFYFFALIVGTPLVYPHACVKG